MLWNPYWRSKVKLAYALYSRDEKGSAVLRKKTLKNGGITNSDRCNPGLVIEGKAFILSFHCVLALIVYINFIKVQWRHKKIKAQAHAPAH